MEFKKLEIEPESNWFKRNLWSQHAKKSLAYIVIGGIGGFLYFYITEGQHMVDMAAGDILKSVLIGAFFGFFITNSPCARGRC